MDNLRTDAVATTECKATVATEIPRAWMQEPENRLKHTERLILAIESEFGACSTWKPLIHAAIHELGLQRRFDLIRTLKERGDWRD